MISNTFSLDFLLQKKLFADWTVELMVNVWVRHVSVIQDGKARDVIWKLVMTAAKNTDSASMGRAYANKVSMAYIVALTHVGQTVMDMDCVKTWPPMRNTDLNMSEYY